MNIVFMGTPEFSVPCLEMIINAGHNVNLVFTQPDKPKNRGHKLAASPVKEFALKKGIEVFQPTSLRKGDDKEASLNKLREAKPDCAVVAAYGQILPKEILDLPKYGCVNIHASLLPKYRGAAPIQRCIINGEKESGVTVMHMAEGLDTGDMIISERTEIPDDMTASQLHDKLSEIGARLIVKALAMLESGTAPRVPQNEELSSYAAMIKKEECSIDFTQTANNVYNKIRGLADSPCAFTFMDGKRLKVYFAEKTGEKSSGAPATVSKGEGLRVNCGDCVLRLTDVQAEGGKRMKDVEFLRGRKIDANTRFTDQR